MKDEERKECLKKIRENLETELENLLKKEKNNENEEKAERIKELLKLSDEELIEELERNYKEKNGENKELSDQELDNVVGGGLFDILKEAFKQADKLINEGHWVEPPKYRCPKCGSRNVKNWDPGVLSNMVVKCQSCGFEGSRDTSKTM